MVGGCVFISLGGLGDVNSDSSRGYETIVALYGACYSGVSGGLIIGGVVSSAEKVLVKKLYAVVPLWPGFTLTAHVLITSL